TSDCTGEEQVEFTEASHATYLKWYRSHSVTQIRPLHPHKALLRDKLTKERKLSFHLAQLVVPFFESITEQVIPEDLLTMNSEIVRAGEARSDADVSEDMHCDESVSGVQEGSNDMSSESDIFLAPTYESEDSVDDIEVNEQGERINVVFEPVNVPSPVNVRLLDENMSLATTLPASRGGNSSSPVNNIFTSVHVECDMQDMREVVVGSEVFGVLASGPDLGCTWFLDLEEVPNQDLEEELDEGCAQEDYRIVQGLLDAVSCDIGTPLRLLHVIQDVLVKKRYKTIEQAAPISINKGVGSTGCHPQTPPPVVTTVESVRDCGMDDGPVKKKPDMDKQRDIQAIKDVLPNKTCLRRRPGHVSIDVTLELLQPDYNVTVEYRKYQRKYP
ncbi:hypothetical protein IFM89_019108, partial [Coptis chinensis]